MENNTFCSRDRMKSPPTLAVTLAVSAEPEVDFYGAHGWNAEWQKRKTNLNSLQQP